MIKALAQKNALYQKNHPFKKNNFQGGVGTGARFLLNNYELDSVAVLRFIGSRSNICRSRDTKFIGQSQRGDFIKSNFTFMRTFNTIKGTSNEILKQKRINESKAGSSCPKKF
jgi:hypothetical protein